jgi:hypothetical protein
VITDNQNSNATTTSIESVTETGPKVGLIDNRQGLLNITTLGHCNNWPGKYESLGADFETYQFRLEDQGHDIA